MTEAFSPLDSREYGKGKYKLLAPLSYQDPVVGAVVVPAGFTTDYASLNVLVYIGFFWLFAMLADYGDRSATIHDYLYSGFPTEDGRYVSRKEADQLFHRALLAEGVVRWRAWFFYVGVRIGGGSSFYTVRQTAIKE